MSLITRVAVADLRKEANTLRSSKTRLENTARDLRDEVKDLKRQPKRISKKLVEEELEKYYTKHPKCKHRMFVTADHVSDLQEQLHSKLEECDEVQENCRTKVAELSEANRENRRLTREANTMQQKLEELHKLLEQAEAAEAIAKKAQAEAVLTSKQHSVSTPSPATAHAANHAAFSSQEQFQTTAVPLANTSNDLCAGRFMTDEPQTGGQGPGRRGSVVNNNFYTINGGTTANQGVNGLQMQRQRQRQRVNLRKAQAQAMMRKAQAQAMMQKQIRFVLQQQLQQQPIMQTNLVQGLSVPADDMW